MGVDRETWAPRIRPPEPVKPKPKAKPRKDEPKEEEVSNGD